MSANKKETGCLVNCVMVVVESTDDFYLALVRRESSNKEPITLCMAKLPGNFIFTKIRANRNNFDVLEAR